MKMSDNDAVERKELQTFKSIREVEGNRESRVCSKHMQSTRIIWCFFAKFGKAVGMMTVDAKLKYPSATKYPHRGTATGEYFFFTFLAVSV